MDSRENCSPNWIQVALGSRSKLHLDPDPSCFNLDPDPSSFNLGLGTYCTLPSKILYNPNTISKSWNYLCTIEPQDRTHLKQTTAVVGLMVNLIMVTTVVTSTTQSMSAGVLLDRSHNNGHLVFLTKDKPMMCPYSNRLVPQSWNMSNGISQRC